MLRNERNIKIQIMNTFWKERRDNLKRTDQLLYGCSGSGGSGGGSGGGVNSSPAVLLEEYTNTTRLNNIFTTMENENQKLKKIIFKQNKNMKEIENEVKILKFQNIQTTGEFFVSF